MRASGKTLVAFFAILFLATTLAVAQTIPQGTFKHIIIVVQENRTPDNLFGASAPVASSPSVAATCGQENNPLIAGADIDNGGPNKTLGGITCNMSLPLSGWDWEPVGGSLDVVGLIDPDHSYNGNYPNGWGSVADFDYYDSTGHMDGFCHEYGSLLWPHPCPSYSYVPLGDPTGDITPYFSIAQKYGFANYMFTTHEGPSFEAHQFLFTGTSAPVAPGDTYNNDNWDFVAELAGSKYGCQETGIGANWVTLTAWNPAGTKTSRSAMRTIPW